MRKEKDGARECGLWGGDKTADEHEGGREEGEGKGGPSRRAKSAGQAGGGRAGVGRRDGHLPIIFQNRIFATAAAAAAAAAAPGGKT